MPTKEDIWYDFGQVYGWPLLNFIAHRLHTIFPIERWIVDQIEQFGQINGSQGTTIYFDQNTIFCLKR